MSNAVMTDEKPTGAINVTPVSLSTAMELVKYGAFPRMGANGELKPGKSIGLIGSPGIGKTASIHALKDEMGYHSVEVLVGAQLSPESIGGIPSVGSTTIIDEEGNFTEVPSTTYLNEPFQVRILKHRKVILLLDEYSNSNESVQAAMLYIFNERRFPDGTPIPTETVIVLATNSMASSVNPTPIAPPTQNRVTWIPVHQPIGGWLEGFKVAWGKPMTDNERRIREMIATYLDKRTDSTLYEMNRDARIERFAESMDENCRDAATYAWRSPRSWENLADLLASLPTEEPKKFHDLAIHFTQMTIGFDGYNAFADALKNYADSLTGGGSAIATMSLTEIFENPEKVSRTTAENDQDNASRLAERLNTYIDDFLPEKSDTAPDEEAKARLLEGIANVTNLISELVDEESPYCNRVFRAPLHAVLEYLINSITNRTDITGGGVNDPMIMVPHKMLSKSHSEGLLKTFSAEELSLPKSINLHPTTSSQQEKLDSQLESLEHNPLTIAGALSARLYPALFAVGNNEM